MTVGMEEVRCPSCGYKNPSISRCIGCGGELVIVGKIPGVNPKDFVQKPKGVWLFIFLALVGFFKSCMRVTVAENSTLFMVLSVGMFVNVALLYGLWKLKPWARYLVLFIGYAGLVVAIWPFIFYVILPSNYYEKITTKFYGEIWGILYSMSAPMIMKFLLIKLLISVSISVAVIVYFHLPKIRRIFEGEPSDW